MVVQRYSFDAFGNITSQAGYISNVYRFQTKELHTKSGLVYFGARWYNPAIGRWLTPDPLGIIDGPNLYIYLNNNPLNDIDPWGLCKGGDKAPPWWEKVFRWIWEFLKSIPDTIFTPPPITSTELAGEAAKTFPKIREYNTDMYEQWQDLIDSGGASGPNPYEDTYRDR